MNFQRGINPKSALGIGIWKDVYSIRIFIFKGRISRGRSTIPILAERNFYIQEDEEKTRKYALGLVDDLYRKWSMIYPDIPLSFGLFFSDSNGEIINDKEDLIKELGFPLTKYTKSKKIWSISEYDGIGFRFDKIN